MIYSSNFDGVRRYSEALGDKVTLNGAYGYMTAGRFVKTSKADNGDVGLINAHVAVNDHFSFGGYVCSCRYNKCMYG